MPRGEPTKAVRLPIWFIDMQQPKADAAGVTLGEHIVKAMTPAVRVPANAYEAERLGGQVAPRCECATPTLSKVVSNLCTTCKRLR